MPLRLKTLRTFILLALCAPLALWAFGFAVFTITSLKPLPDDSGGTTDAIIVLTGGTNRIEEGLALFAAGRARHLFISGVYPHVSKADIEQLWTGDTALPPCCITLGHKATSTVENAEETRIWLVENNYTSLRLVTSNYHMHRAMLELRHAIPGVRILPHPIVQPDLTLTTKHLWTLFLSEYHKYIFRRLQLLVTPRSPRPGDDTGGTGTKK